MTIRWVSNASPLILLGKIDCIEPLPRLSDTLVIPRATAKEARAGSKDDPARTWLQASGQEFVRSSGTVISEVAAWDLGRGESSVLSGVRPVPVRRPKGKRRAQLYLLQGLSGVGRSAPSGC
jgi:hypothetical protein